MMVYDSPLVLKIEQTSYRDTRWRSWLRHCATSRKVVGSIPNGIFGIFRGRNPSGSTTTPGSTYLLTEMSSRNMSCGVMAASA